MPLLLLVSEPARLAAVTLVEVQWALGVGGLLDFVAEWIDFTLFGTTLDTIRLHFLGLMNSATKSGF